MDAVLRRRGLMLVLSSPSGAGKTTISRQLLAADPNLQMSVSATTRAKRPGETAGVDYHFVDGHDFSVMLNKGEMLEHAKVFDYYYGTPKQRVDDALKSGKDVLFDIDWQGTQQLGESARDDLVSVFILPPSTRALEERLAKRAQDPPEVVARRMSEAASEMSHYPEYDYVIVNDDLAASVARVQSILAAERSRRDRLIGLSTFVQGLQAGY